MSIMKITKKQIFNDTNKVFCVTEIEPLLTKSSVVFSNTHLSYYEFLSASRQSVKPYIWLGNVGMDNLDRATRRVPPANLYAFKNVYLAGLGCIVDQDNRLFVSPFMHMDKHFLQSGGNSTLIDLDGDEVRFNKKLNIIDLGDAACVPLSQPGQGIYGHWLVDILPRVMFAKSLNIKLKYIFAQNIPSYAKVFLELLGINEEDIFVYNPNKEVVLMQNCYFPSHLRLGSAFSPLAAKFNQSLAPYQSPCKNTKLFISRGNYNNKQTIANSSELLDLVKCYDFEILEPHNYSIKEQIKLFSEAGLIVGEYGSAMHNTLFAHPEAKVVVLQSEATAPFVQAGIGALLNQPTGFVFGKPVGDQCNRGRSFSASLEDVRQVLES